LPLEFEKDSETIVIAGGRIFEPEIIEVAKKTIKQGLIV
jgi:hypothetical protein